jgi:hypothetical protein
MKTKLLAVFGTTLLALLMTSATVFADPVTVGADVDKYITATFNYASVTYGSLTAGSSNNVAPNQADGVYNVSVDTNFGYTVSASGTQFSDGGSHNFNVNNLKMDSNSTAGNLAVGSATTLSGAPQVVDTYAYTVTDNFHGFWLSVPAGQYATSYSSTVTVSYANQ